MKGKENAVALASVAARLGGRLREQSGILVRMAEAALEGNWAEFLAKSRDWARNEALAKRDADVMLVILRGMDAGTVKEHLRENGLTAEQAAAIAGLGGTDGWD